MVKFHGCIFFLIQLKGEGEGGNPFWGNFRKVRGFIVRTSRIKLLRAREGLGPGVTSVTWLLSGSQYD